VAAEFTYPPGALPPPPPPLGDPTAGPPPRFLGSLPVAPSRSDRVGQAWTAFCPGVAGVAHGDDLNSGESQIFFLMVHADNLEATFTAWGRVLVGAEVLPTLAPGEPPAAPDRVITARIAADLPAAERPSVDVIDTTGPAFDRLVRDLMRRNNIAPRPCDITLTARLRAPGA
jgi:peptidylprolyl isomerase